MMALKPPPILYSTRLEKFFDQNHLTNILDTTPKNMITIRFNLDNFRCKSKVF